jgi:dipeptidyl aminopeptidase/acylaminoacyl peptidase
MRDRPERPYGQLWLMDLSTEKSVRLGGDKPASGPVWSGDSQWVAFQSADGDKHGLWIAHPDGSDTTFLAAMAGTNSPLPGTGKEVTWSPDGKQIAFVSSTAGEEAAEANGDPMVITRYLYKPDAGEGLTRFNDNQRLHIFVVDISSKRVRQIPEAITMSTPLTGRPMESNLSSPPTATRIRMSSSTTTFSRFNSPTTVSAD